MLDLITALLIIGFIIFCLNRAIKLSKNKPQQKSKPKPEPTYSSQILDSESFSTNKPFTYVSTSDHQVHKIEAKVELVVDQSPSNSADAWEGTFRDGVNAYEIEAHLRFDYIDLNGTRTTRTVWTREADDVYGMMLAYCELRDATRSFRYYGISNCVDLDTGEVVEDIGDYLYKKYLSSPEYAMLKFTEENLDLVKCLLYISKADGQMRKEERDIIAQVCISGASSSLITEETIKNMLSGLQIPSIHAFKLAVGRIANNNHNQFRILAKAASDIVNTQQTIHANEQAALDYIAKKAAAVKIDL